jgi:serine/threonine protein kinase
MAQGVAVPVIREASFLKFLRHDNIIHLHDVIVSPSHVHLVLELCCCNMRQYLAELHRLTTGMETAQLMSYSRQLIAAVSHCHEHHCIHRDVKPDNILLDCQRRSLKLADFGSARCMSNTAVDEADARARVAYTPGAVSLWYRPPEIILGDAAYSTAVDVWSTGCTIAEMANLEPVFSGGTEVQCLIRAFSFIPKSPV